MGNNAPVTDVPDCLTAEVRQFLSAYRSLLKEKEREAFLEENSIRLKSLQDRQERFICRLFADAFATVFGGPVYLYALLLLRFWPDELPSPDMPSFTDRFFFSLEILRRMNDSPKKFNAEQFSLIFDDEIHRLEQTWNSLRHMAPLDTTDEKLKQKYGDWIDKIYDCCSNFMKVNIQQTYTDWVNSKDLMKVIIQGEEAGDALPDRHPSMWMVLNAAWRVRLEQADGAEPELELADAIENALRLLDPEDNSLIHGAPRRKGELIQEQRRRPKKRAEEEGVLEEVAADRFVSGQQKRA